MVPHHTYLEVWTTGDRVGVIKRRVSSKEGVTGMS